MNPFCKVDTVGDVGEKELIRRIRARFGDAMPQSPYGAGDDCALIERDSLKKNIYATTDAVIYGRHFDDTATAREVGEKLFKRNASDIASMGARPFAALTSSIFSKNLSLKWLDDFCAGLSAAAEKYSVKLIGGDTASVGGDFFSMHLTMLGQSDAKPLLRSEAAEGEYIYVTGALGRSFESRHHLTFTPRIEQGVWLASQGGIGACTDISDGIASDLKNILPAGFCAVLNVDSIPLRKFDGQVATLEQALCDGEDYELLFTYGGDICAFEDSYLSKFGVPIYRIGRIKKASSSKEDNALLLSDGKREVVFCKSGFDHSAL